jgi:hypothetical protein
MTDAAACAVLTVGRPVVSIAALQELRELLDAVAPRAPDPTHASTPSKEGGDALKESVDPDADPAVPTRRGRAPHRADRLLRAPGADPRLGRALAARRGRRIRYGPEGRA